MLAKRAEHSACDACLGQHEEQVGEAAAAGVNARHQQPDALESERLGGGGMQGFAEDAGTDQQRG